MKHDWEYKKAAEVCTVVTDYVANGSFATLRENVQYKNEKDYAVLVRLADYTNDFDIEKFVYVNKHAYDFLAKSTLYGGEIIMSNVGSVGKSFICPDLGVPMTLAPNSILIRTTNNPFYFYYFKSNTFLRQLNSITSKTALPKFNKTEFKKLLFPVPPLPVQEQICSLLDKLSLVIEKKKQQVKELDNLAQATFYDMFGDVNTNNHSYDIQTLSSVCEILTDGTHQTPEYTQDIVNGVKFLSAKDVVGGVINWNNIKYIPQSLHESLYSRLAPKRNDILLCKNGTTGIAAVVETDEIFDIYVSLALLRLKDGYLPKYILYAINNPTTKQQFDDSLKGVGVPNLHLGEIKKTRIVVPPLPLQQSFAQKVEAIERQKKLINQSIREAQTLFDSRMEYYFGE